MRGVGGPLLCIGDLLSDVGESNPDASQPTDLHLPSSSSSPSSISASHSIDLTKLFEENYKNLNEALAGSDHSWTALTLKLCSALDTANRLAQSTNSNVRLLSEKVAELEEVVKKGDSVVAAVRGVVSSLSENERTTARTQ
ncbi:histone-lysine N-methyltransferase [Trema orientale]|uniref:Histone-lysine N-methyltransferase n=1 Tax=Trema orientale TaxID=63057 RepID=A0A2P5E5Q7_TREOI|nr:histone-lysine N-methyltransferase [Trema orientale]